MEERINDILDNLFATEEYSDCFLVDVKQSGNKVEVFVDSDDQIDFEKCRSISRHLEQEYLDVEKPLGDSYTLDVSSPGVGRPLKFYRQYPKNVGRNLEVTTTDGDVYTGKLLTVEPSRIVLEAKVRRKEGKRKKTVVEEIEIAFDAIKKSIVKISF
ncbi:ribosome maturation factor [Lewinellaceae bacterium SD302]|nr:ribosome maturation factor [Lewinellaceae bacterium SD302]